MSLDTHVRPQPTTIQDAVDVDIVPRMDRIDLVTRVLGYGTDVARAELTGMSEKTWERARGGRRIGKDFIGRLLVALRAHETPLAARNLSATFDDLFEVRVRPVGGSRS